MAFTFFFRDRHTLNHLVNFLKQNLKTQDKIRIWDAGCAMGQEPYTLSILFAEALNSDEFKRIKIEATDIDEQGNYGEVIRKGIYPLDQLSRLPDGILEKYFVKYDEANNYKLITKILDSLEYQRHNLLEYQAIGQNFDAVVCKNVLLHFQFPDQVKVINMFFDSLKVGGYLITEQTQALPAELLHRYEKIITDANIFRKIQ
jgi:chemotaxis protein methyltransferase CheR